MRIFLVMTFLLATMTTIYGQNRQMISLEECVERALVNNTNLQRSKIATRRDDIRYRQAYLNILPSVSANLGQGYYQGRSVDPITNQYTEETFGSGSQGLHAGMTIFNGFKMFHDIRKEASARSAGRLEFESAVNDLKLDVIESYISVLTSSDLLTQSERQLELTTEQLRRAEVMQNEGAGQPGDYFDIKGQFKRDENNVENSRKNYYSHRLRLARLMGIDETELGELQELEIQIQDVSTGKSELFASASQHLPQIKALDYRIKEARHQIRSSKADYFPSISLNAGLNSNYSNQVPVDYIQQFNNNLGKSLSISLRIPLFNRLQTYHQVRNTQLSYKDAELMKKFRLEELNEATAQNVFNLSNTISNVRNLEEQVVYYAESFRIAQVHFDTGLTNSYLYLAAKNKMDNANQELVLKKYEYVFQQYVNDYYNGTLDL